jgi:hypothetical protein
MMAFKTPEEAAKSLGNTISAGRLAELAEAGYAPHYLIDGKGPWFKIAELREWFDRNAVQARGGLPMPTRLSLVLDPPQRPAADAPTCLSHLDGLLHLDPAHLWHPGVYFLCQDDEVVYIGQSVMVPGRVMGHIRQAKKVFDRERVYYLPVPEGELLRMESEMIRQLEPRYNGDSSGNGKLARRHPTDTCQTDPHKAVVDALWHRLPDAVKAAVAAMVQAAAIG